MSIFNLNGAEIFFAYEINGTETDKAFSADGSIVYVKTRSIKVMTYNVGSWYDGNHDIVPSAKDADYYALQSGMIEANDPDIMFMNEYTKNFSKAGRTSISVLQEFFPYIHEQGGDSDTSTSGRCIASKYPITNYTVRNFNDGGYYYDTCVVTINGVQIHLIITHLHWNDRSKRISEINTIISLASTYDRFILAGDFNTADCYNTSGEDYTAVIAPLLQAGFHCANCIDDRFLVTYEDNGWTGCLDNIVTSSNILISNVYVDETKLYDTLADKTDHLPLIATLTI